MRWVLASHSCDNLIIGGGLSGIYAAFLLAERGEEFVLLEARSRLGGRILSPLWQGMACDLGPSWYWPEIQPLMVRLIEHFELPVFRQYEEGNGRYQLNGNLIRNLSGYVMEPLSFRLEGGMIRLVEVLRQRISPAAIFLESPVCGLVRCADGVEVTVGRLEEEPRAVYQADRVILALPPRLAAATILFTPELSHELTQALLQIPTWMACQAKFSALYEEPFWRHQGLSGQGFSQCGPMAEIHDGSADGGFPAGLIGFLGVPAAGRREPEPLQQAILEQLALLYGQPAAHPAMTFYQDWAREPFTATFYDQPPLREHPLYRPPAGQTAIWDGLVAFAGTETSEHQGGYLEGALYAAARAVDGNPLSRLPLKRL